MSAPKVATIIIGRNEGARFKACLASLPKGLARVIYVDSGSTDGSVEAAQAYGAEVVSLDLTQPFTAARARNTGLELLSDDITYVQMIDGDCALQDGWIEAAVTALQANAQLAVVCGRRRERFPEASVYNRLCDHEWDTPIGPAKACGGDAMMRLSALKQVGFYDATLIAGEEPELCVRLRRGGWQIERLDADMTWHDANMTRLAQWWRRSTRAGHAYGEGAALHGAPPERHWVRETRRALVWGAGLPIAILAGALLCPWVLLLLLVYPAQMLRLGRKDTGADRWERAFFTVLGKLPEAQGVLSYHLTRLRGKRKKIIEYK